MGVFEPTPTRHRVRPGAEGDPDGDATREHPTARAAGQRDREAAVSVSAAGISLEEVLTEQSTFTSNTLHYRLGKVKIEQKLGANF